MFYLQLLTKWQKPSHIFAMVCNFIKWGPEERFLKIDKVCSWSWHFDHTTMTGFFYLPSTVSLCFVGAKFQFQSAECGEMNIQLGCVSNCFLINGLLKVISRCVCSASIPLHFWSITLTWLQLFYSVTMWLWCIKMRWRQNGTNESRKLCRFSFYGGATVALWRAGLSSSDTRTALASWAFVMWLTMTEQSVTVIL